MSDSDEDSLFTPQTKFINGAYHMKPVNDTDETDHGIEHHLNSTNIAYKNKMAFCGFSGVDGRAPHYMGERNYVEFLISILVINF